MYCIEKYFKGYRISSKLDDLINSYFVYQFIDYLYDRTAYSSLSSKGKDFDYFLNNIKIINQKDTCRYINLLMDFLCKKSKTIIPLYGPNKIFADENDMYCKAAHFNKELWIGFTHLVHANTPLFSKIVDLQKRAVISDLKNKSKTNNLWLPFAFLLFEVRFRLNKAEHDIYSRSPWIFLNYLEGLNAIN